MSVFVARQPIFNRRKKVVGYELLFRSGNDNFYRQAVVMLGVNELKKLLSVIALGYLGEDKPNELYGLSMIRARFAELLCSQDREW